MPHYTNRFFAAADELEKFVRSNMGLLEEYLKALHEAEMETLRDQDQVRRAFETASGITARQKVDHDDPAPPDLIVTGNLYEDYDATMARLTGEFKKKADAVRQSEYFKRKLDIWDELRGQFLAARMECTGPEDHPLLRAGREPKPAWMIQLDEKNFDLAAATTLEEKLEVEKNIRDLADWEENERRAAETQFNKNKPSTFVEERAREQSAS